MPKLRYTQQQVKELSDFISRAQLERCSDKQIASRLNNADKRTANGNTWLWSNVAGFRKTHMNRKRYRSHTQSTLFTQPQLKAPVARVQATDTSELVELIVCSNLSADKKIEMLRVCVR